jgi:hypothetical protein
MIVPLVIVAALSLSNQDRQVFQLAQYCPPGPFYNNCMFQEQQRERQRELQEQQQQFQMQQEQQRQFQLQQEQVERQMQFRLQQQQAEQQRLLQQAEQHREQQLRAQQAEQQRQLGHAQSYRPRAFGLPANPNGTRAAQTFSNTTGTARMTSTRRFGNTSSPSRITSTRTFGNTSGASGITAARTFGNTSTPSGITSTRTFGNTTHLSGITSTRTFGNNRIPSIAARNTPAFSVQADPSMIQSGNLATSTTSARGITPAISSGSAAPCPATAACLAPTTAIPGHGSSTNNGSPLQVHWGPAAPVTTPSPGRVEEWIDRAALTENDDFVHLRNVGNGPVTLTVWTTGCQNLVVTECGPQWTNVTLAAGSQGGFWMKRDDESKPWNYTVNCSASIGSVLCGDSGGGPASLQSPSPQQSSDGGDGSAPSQPSSSDQQQLSDSGDRSAPPQSSSSDQQQSSDSGDEPAPSQPSSSDQQQSDPDASDGDAPD